MTQDQELQQAIKILSDGGIVAMPTETVYGLAAMISNDAGLRQIFSIKERPFFDPLIVHIAHWQQRNQVVRSWPRAAEILSKKFWPGPLTLVLPKHLELNPLITSGLDTVGIRMPSHPLAQTLISQVNCPLAAPSANKFGRTSPTTAEHVRKSFIHEDIFVLDGGPSEVGLESTVVGIEEKADNTVITVFRPGFITKKMLEETLKNASLPFTITQKASAASPGHLEQHYMPALPLVIVAEKLTENVRRKICSNFQLPEQSTGREIVLNENPKLAARFLYAKMREGTEIGNGFLYVLKTSARSGDLWNSIWDRLERASSAHY